MEFNDNGVGGTDWYTNEMQAAVENALKLYRKNSSDFTAILLTGSTTAITGWNWKYLLEFYSSGSGWTNLEEMDLSGMGSLTKVENEKVPYAMSFHLTTVHFPTGLETIGDRAFAGCYSLEAFVVSPDNQAFASVDGVLYDKEMETLLQYPRVISGTSFAIPDKVQTIGAVAFNSCNGLQNVSFPE